MRTRFRPIRLLLAAVLLALLTAPAQAGEGLRILLTNDDGFDSIGITTLQSALVAAGHDVTVVAPLTQQSGKGGSLNTGVGTFVDVIEESPGVWSVDSTPADAVRAALGAVLSEPPELIVSGCNFGQNLAQPGSNASGTVGAALQGIFSGIPAIACSVELLLSEARDEPFPFPSTVASFGPAADFIVRLIDELEARPRPTLPDRTVLNVNIPVPYADIQGVRVTRLAQRGDFDFVWQDVAGVIASGGGPILINIDPNTDPTGRGTDLEAQREGLISITPLDGDMTSGPSKRGKLRARLKRLEP